MTMCYYWQPRYRPNISLKQYPEIIRLTKILFRDCRPAYQRNIAMYLANLWRYGNVAVSRDKEWFYANIDKTIRDSWHSWHRAVSAQNLLLNLDLVEIWPGRRKKGYEDEKGISSVLSPTPELQSLFEGLPNDAKNRPNLQDRKGIAEIRINRENIKYLRTIPNNIQLLTQVELQELQVPTRVDIQLCAISAIPIPDTFFKKSLRDCKRINAYLADIRLGYNKELIQHLKTEWQKTKKKKNGEPIVYYWKQIWHDPYENVHLTRDFKIEFINAERKCKNKRIQRTRTGDGRFYMRGGYSYQNVPKEVRATMTINDAPTVEVDFSGMHPRLLYNLRGLNCPDQIYEPIVRELIGRDDENLREAIKAYLLICINARNPGDSKKALRWREKDAYKVLQHHNITPEHILRAVEQIHPDIAGFLNTDIGIKLMFHDSNIMNNILLRLRKEHIKGVPLHDSIICQLGSQQRVEQIMKEEYEKYTGFPARVG